MARALVYSQNFANALADTELAAFDARWTRCANRGAGTATVKSGTKDVRQAGADTTGSYRYTERTLVDQMIVATCLPGGVMLHARMDANGNGYDCSWSNNDNELRLQRTTANGATHTQVANGGTVAGGSPITRCFMRVVTVSASLVRVECGDDVNGTIISFDDTDAARFLVGQPGIFVYDFTPLTCAWDDIKIYDENYDASRRTLAPQQRMG